MASEAALYRLLAWLSPAYPTGAYSYSHGIEAAVDAGLVTGRSDLVAWVGGILSRGGGRVDGAMFVAAWRAVAAGDLSALDTVVEFAAAWRGTAELALESRAQGSAFLTITGTAWPVPKLETLVRRYETITLPVAVALAAACHGLPLQPALTAYLAAFAANLVSAGVRLIPLGQSDGQAAIAVLEADVAAAVNAALGSDLGQIGTAAPMVDWCSMRHEVQYSRLFRS
ncbi:MAG: urease accessory protein UreF [Proteobacteria bacterium]|nr:urease accessory protein UreF [Pseudomonadota bacterium]MBI3497452.1 urease accessory protein UreF [Pseudomonadota bacterium]